MPVPLVRHFKTTYLGKMATSFPQVKFASLDTRRDTEERLCHHNVKLIQKTLTLSRAYKVNSVSWR